MSYRFVVIFLPLTILVEVDTDLKLPIPPPPPPNEEEEKEVNPPPPPPMSPKELKPKNRISQSKKQSLNPFIAIIYYNIQLTAETLGVCTPVSNPEKPGPKAGKPPKPKSGPLIRVLCAPL